ncbi:MAG: ATP-binding protein [Methyloceanibacter sp.]
MLKNLRTSTKLLLLCSMFVASIILATYSLIEEKQIAIGFVRKELVGVQSLESLRGVYSIILAEDSKATQDAQAQASVDGALNALTASETTAPGSLQTANLAQSLAAIVRRLSSAGPDGEKRALIVEALAKARDLAARIGDESNLALDPDLDSYYVQNIVVKRVPALLSEMGELQSLLRAASLTDSPSSNDLRVRRLLLNGMIRSTIEEIERDSAAAYRGDANGQLKEAIAGAIGSMRSTANAYLGSANMTLNRQASSASLAPMYGKALESINDAWTVSQEQLRRLLNNRLSNLVGKLQRSLVLNGLVAGLSLLLAMVTYRQIVRPLGQLEGLASKVRETKDYGLRVNLHRRDEIGRLAGAFNAMLEELAAAREREISDQERSAAMQAELARVSRLTTMGEMAASIAHEINQPLAGVVNNANAGLRWLNNRPPNIDEVGAALRRIVNDGERGSGIIESIRAMLKKDDRKKVKLDLNELICEVMRLTQGQFQRHGVSIRSELADNLPTVSADRVQLQQVILNLLMNAAEATASSSNREHPVCVRSEKHDGDCVRISVEDSGTGIKPEDEKRIFEAFFTTKADGMGMGLSICRSIVQSHGGRITAAKAMPRGSVFQVILPGSRT